MALLDASNSQIAFSPTTAFASVGQATPTVYTWTTTTPGNLVGVNGTGFTYFGNLPLSGTVTDIIFDFKHSSHDRPGVALFAENVPQSLVP